MSAMKVDSELCHYLQQRLQGRAPRQIHQADLSEAGVLVAITDEPAPHLILTRRAGHLSTHRGEVAFPGGKRDPEDESIIATALREAEEEIHLSPSQVHIIGEMDQVVSRFGYIVTPVLALVEANVELEANLDELDAVFRVPLTLFMDEPSRYYEVERLKIPSYDFQEFHIWGLTAMMIAEMMNHLWDSKIEMQI